MTARKKIRRPYIIHGKRCWISGYTEQEVLEKGIDIYVNSEKLAIEKHNFSAFAKNWFENYSKPNVSTATAATYERQLRIYILPKLGDKNVEDITLNDVQPIFNTMSGSKETKIKCKMVLNMIFNLAIENGYMEKNPLQSSSFRLKGKPSETTQVYSVEEMQYLASHISSLTNQNDVAYMALQIFHPLRLEEVLGVQWQDIDKSNMVIHIRRAVTHPTRNAPEVKSTKTDEYRDVALSSTALGYLDTLNYNRTTNDFVVGGNKPLSYTQVRRMCERIARVTGFDGKITPIRFRTTVLTDIYEQTGDIKLTQQAAGHKTAETTLKHYVKGRRTNAESANVIDKIYSDSVDEFIDQ